MSEESEPPLVSGADLLDGLVDDGVIAPSAATRVRHLQAETSEQLDRVLTRLGLVTEAEVATRLAAMLGLPQVAAAAFPVRALHEERLSVRFLRKARVLPLVEEVEGLSLAMADPLDDVAAEAVAYAIGRPVLRRVAVASDIDRALDRLYVGSSRETSVNGEGGEGAVAEAASHAEDAERLRDLASDAPVVRLVNRWLAEAVEAEASDIHLEPSESALLVRLRVDGVLVELDSQPAALHAAVVSRLKIMARLDIGERRLPQDGRLDLTARGRRIDVRVSILPAVRGESVVLRLLDRGGVVFDFEALGFDARTRERFLKVVERPHGILLVTGPTGSGKTTTLYTALARLRRPDYKILTAEDPVEYRLEGVIQTQVKPQIGLGFANLLRSFLRHDPDVILVGEIRDLETARIAAQAALTGHLVLSTLHTNDAAGAITRLVDMGLEDYLLTATINGIAAQRLVRRLCGACREPYAPGPELLARLGLERATGRLWRAVGCTACNGTGYKGRSAIMEVLAMSERLRQLVMRQAGAEALRAAAVEEDMTTLFQAGLGKAQAGETSIEEVLRVAGAQ